MGADAQMRQKKPAMNTGRRLGKFYTETRLSSTIMNPEVSTPESVVSIHFSVENVLMLSLSIRVKDRVNTFRGISVRMVLAVARASSTAPGANFTPVFADCCRNPV